MDEQKLEVSREEFELLQKILAEEKPNKERRCVECGYPMGGKHHLAKYCSQTCKITAKKRKGQVYYEQHKEHYRELAAKNYQKQKKEEQEELEELQEQEEQRKQEVNKPMTQVQIQDLVIQTVRSVLMEPLPEELPNKTRREYIIVHLSKDEKRQLTILSNAKGLSLGAYLRMRMLEQ